MTLQAHELSKERRRTYGVGLLKGLGVTLKHLFKHNTVIQYPDEKQDLPARTRGVIALKEENCTVCMLCGRECPDWCIYIDSHKETLPPKRQGGRPRKRNVLDRFAIDYALCMYCGICVEVCPYDALFWSREFEYAEYDIRELTHEKEKLSDWMASVLPPPSLEEGAELPGEPATAAGAAGAGAAQRPSPPAQVTAAEQRPQQAARAPEAAAAPAPAPSAATPAQEQAGETRPAAEAAAAPTEQTVDRAAGERAATETVSEARTEGPPPEAPQPEALRAEAEEAPALEAEAAPGGAEAGEAAYRQVLEEQLARGASPQVAEARARVARVKAERGLRRARGEPSGNGHAEARPVPPQPGGAPQAEEPRPQQGPVAPEAAERESPAPAEAEAPEAKPEPQAEAEAPEAEAPKAEAKPEPQAEAEAPEDPDAIYERVLASERAKGSSDAVAVARAKAARVRAQKGTKGPGG
jgi:formate hydrogenlyase subunit 6/NADH:ubiquinone oxidoreductase subunit I